MRASAEDIYLDHHATTPVEPEVVEAMLPYFSEQFANPGSITHRLGRAAASAVQRAVATIATGLGAAEDEIILTSGATESNNLALLGYCLHPRQERRRIVSVATEHPSVLDPLRRLEKMGFEVVMAPVHGRESSAAGRIRLEETLPLINDETALVSVMLANNEIGTIQPVAAIAEWCRQLDVCVHTDATQAVGRIPVDVDSLDVDLLSFSAHKMYGPKGVGGLFVRRRERRIRLQPQILGGGHQHNMRSGTLNVPGIVGMATALKVCLDRMPAETERLMGLRKSLWERLCSQAPFVSLNGPALDEHPNGALHRLPNNLNCSFYPVEGQSLMLEVPQIAVSSGSACTSAHPEPSHVLRAIGLSLDEARSSLRFGLGRINTSEEVLAAADLIAEAAERLRKLV